VRCGGGNVLTQLNDPAGNIRRDGAIQIRSKSRTHKSVNPGVAMWWWLHGPLHNATCMWDGVKGELVGRSHENQKKNRSCANSKTRAESAAVSFSRSGVDQAGVSIHCNCTAAQSVVAMVLHFNCRGALVRRRCKVDSHSFCGFHHVSAMIDEQNNTRG